MTLFLLQAFAFPPLPKYLQFQVSLCAHVRVGHPELLPRAPQYRRGPSPVPEVSSVLAKARPSSIPPYPTLTSLTPFPFYWGPRKSTAMSVLRTQSRTITGQKKERSSTDALQLMDLIFTRFTKIYDQTNSAEPLAGTSVLERPSLRHRWWERVHSC